MRPTRTAFAVVMAYSFAINYATPCCAFLIDDFSIDQAGISTNQFAEFDTLLNPGLWGGQRIIWGGGASIPGACAECEISAQASAGRFFITPGDDCPGAGAVSWGGPGLNLTGETGIQLTISELTGIAWTRISISSGGDLVPRNHTVRRLDVYFDSAGVFTIPFSQFPGPIALQDINDITISTYLDLGEFIAFDSVSAIPEPSKLLLFVIGFSSLLRMRFRR